MENACKVLRRNSFDIRIVCAFKLFFEYQKAFLNTQELRKCYPACTLLGKNIGGCILEGKKVIQEK